MKWMIIAVMYMTADTNIAPLVSVNAEWKFQNREACLSHLYKTSAQYKDELLEVYPDIKKFHLTCVHKNTVQKLHKKYKKNEI